MRKRSVATLLVVCILAVSVMTGCGNKKSNTNIDELTETVTNIDELIENVTYTVDLSQYPLKEAEWLFGEVLSVENGTLLVKPYSAADREAYGQVVYIIADNAADFKKGDYVSAAFTEVDPPATEGGPLIIRAEELRRDGLYDKPVIYLYPETATVCSVKVTLDGYLTCTYPAHGAEGWQDFTAYPDGTLIFPDGSSYYCLYWEGRNASDFDFSSGFCVRGSDTAAFLADILPRLGLTAREANEFIIYWLPQMQDAPYNVISFQTEAYTDTAKLEITPAPDTLLRVFMAFYPSEEAVDIPAQEITPCQRQGFTVVEWGGSQVDGQE